MTNIQVKLAFTLNLLIFSLGYIRMKIGISDVPAFIWYSLAIGCAIFIYCHIVIYWYPRISGQGSVSTKLITNGPYRYTRHPIYTALVLSTLILFSNPIPKSFVFYFLFIIWLGVIVALSYLQEKETLDRFGDEAVEYYKKTPRLFFMYPFIRSSHK